MVQNSTYSALSSNVYQACYEACSSCDGPLSTNCQTCKSSFMLSTTGLLTECVTSCAGASNPSLCRTCHPQCLNCRGASNQLCVACKEDTISLNGITTCVPECRNGTFLARVSNSNFDFECRGCDPLCLNCTGPNKADCTQCRGPSDIVNGHLVCLESCPSNTYQAPNGTCQACNNLCSVGCSGSTSRDCNACTELSVSISETITECSRSCPSGMEYDSFRDVCTFSM